MGVSLLSPRLVAEAVALLSCTVAVITDLRTRRIPNSLTASAALLAVVFHLTLGFYGHEWQAALSGLTGGAASLLLFSLLSLRGLVGFGDTKLIATLGLWLGAGSIAEISLYTLLAGGPLAIIHGFMTGQLRGAARNIADGKVLCAPSLDTEPEKLHPMPYALAIACGTLWEVAGDHGIVPALW